MRLSPRSFLLILIVLAVVPSGARAILPNPKPPIAQSTPNTQQQQAQQKKTSSPPPAVVIQNPPAAESTSDSTDNEGYDEQRNAWLKVWFEGCLDTTVYLLSSFNFWLKVVGAGQVYWLKKTRDETQRAAQAARENASAAQRYTEIAQQTLILAHRPKLIVRNFTIEQLRPLAAPTIPLFAPGHHVRGHFYVANVGSTKATIRAYSSRAIPIQTGLPMERPDEGFQGIPPIVTDLEPGESTALQFSSVQLGPEGPLIRQRSNKWTFFVLGWIEYQDSIGVIRRTWFCREWDADKQRLLPVDDSDYEHAD